MDSKRALRQLAELRRLGGSMRLAADGWKSEWQCLIATIMSAQSRDETTIIIAERLFEKFDSLDKLAEAKYNDVLNVLSSLNYNRTKARNIIACAQALVRGYGGKVPHDFDKLIELHGVGRKTANVFLSEYGHDGLAVDTHVFYIARKIGWSSAHHPHNVEEDLKKLFPSRFWSKVNPILVKFGKLHTSRKHKDVILDEIKDIK